MDRNRRAAGGNAKITTPKLKIPDASEGGCRHCCKDHAGGYNGGGSEVSE
jgi:hypothetical protein